MTKSNDCPGHRRSVSVLHRCARWFGLTSARDCSGLDPGVRARKGRRVERLHDSARAIERDRNQAFLMIPLPLEEFAVFCLECFELSSRFQSNLQLGQVEVTSVTKSVEEVAIEDLGQHLVAGADAPVGRDVENHRPGGDLLADGLDEHLDARVADLLREPIARASAHDLPILDSEPEKLGEAGFTGTEETGDPDADPLMRLVRGLAVSFEDGEIVFLDRTGRDILADLVAEDFLLDLVDFDDLFDPAPDVVCKE